MVALHGDSVVFGSTSQPGGPVHDYTSAGWSDFIAGAKLG